MMLIATTAAAALFATTAFAAAPAGSASAAVPPMIVTVTALSDVPPQLIARVLAESDAIWRASGITFIWQRTAHDTQRYARSAEIGPYVPDTLRLNIGDNRGDSNGTRRPLGWVVFNGDQTPEREIYLSRA